MAGKALLLAALLLPLTAQAEDFGNLKLPAKNGESAVASVAGKPADVPNAECAAQDIPSGASCTTDRFCTDIESCKRFCCCACDHAPLTGSWWEEPVYGKKTTCERGPQTGAGFIAPDSPDLLDLATELQGSGHLLGLSDKRATREVVEGLRQLDTIVAAWPNKPKGQDVKVRIHNCYRRAIGNTIPPKSTDGNAEAVCGMVFKYLHVENSPTAPEELKASWRRNAANKWQMTWPGPTPHAAGVACDIVLTDGAGTDCFDVAAGPQSGQHCSIDGKTASSLLDDAVTQTGGRRLAFEAWHYEWGGGTDCRCQHPDCVDKFWPPTGTQRCR